MKAGSRAAAGGLPVARMKRWYLAGDSNSTIGRRLGLHPSTVRRVLIEAGVTMRTRREQVALHDARAGVRIPSAEELAAGYVDEGLTSAELADRYGITEARVHSMLCRYGIERRPGGIRPARADAERAQRRPPQLIEDIVTLYRSGLSRTATAARVGVHRKLVDDVLHRAGVEFRDRRKLPPVSEWANRYVDDGETAAEIAATFAVAPETVLHALAAAGIERRPAKVRMPPLIDDEVVACYVRERMSLQATAKRLGVSTPRVRAAVGRLGVLRTKFDPSTLDRRRFARRYAAGATFTELGDEFGLTPHQVSVAVRTFDLPPRLPVTHRPLTITRARRLRRAGQPEARPRADGPVHAQAVRRDVGRGRAQPDARAMGDRLGHDPSRAGCGDDVARAAADRRRHEGAADAVRRRRAAVRHARGDGGADVRDRSRWRQRAQALRIRRRRHARAGQRLLAADERSTSSRFASMSARETRLSRHSRRNGSVFDARTLKCQSS